MKKSVGSSRLRILRKAGVALLIGLVAASALLIAVACCWRPIPPPLPAQAPVADGPTASPAQKAGEPGTSPGASGGPQARTPRPDPRSPELPGKFERAKFHVAPGARPLPPIMAKAPVPGLADTPRQPPPSAAVTRNPGGAKPPAGAPAASGAADQEEPRSAPSARGAMNPPE